MSSSCNATEQYFGRVRRRLTLASDTRSRLSSIRSRQFALCRRPRAGYARLQGGQEMNAAIVARTLSLIPDRVSRMQTGSVFDPSAPCAHPDRVAHLLQFLTWLGPLQPLTKDDLRILGLMTPYAKPAISLADEDGEDDGVIAPDEL